MTEIEIAEYRGGIHLLREQLRYGHLTIYGIRQAHEILTGLRSTLPTGVRDECDWLLAQLEAELTMRERDNGASAA